MDTTTTLALRSDWVAAGRPSQGHPYCALMAQAAAQAEEIPLPVAWRMLASGDPGAVFDGVFLLLHPDGSVTWTQHPEDGERVGR